MIIDVYGLERKRERERVVCVRETLRSRCEKLLTKIYRVSSINREIQHKPRSVRLDREAPKIRVSLEKLDHFLLFIASQERSSIFQKSRSFMRLTLLFLLIYSRFFLVLFRSRSINTLSARSTLRRARFSRIAARICVSDSLGVFAE